MLIWNSSLRRGNTQSCAASLHFRCFVNVCTSTKNTSGLNHLANSATCPTYFRFVQRTLFDTNPHLVVIQTYPRSLALGLYNQAGYGTRELKNGPVRSPATQTVPIVVQDTACGPEDWTSLITSVYKKHGPHLAKRLRRNDQKTAPASNIAHLSCRASVVLR